MEEESDSKLFFQRCSFSGLSSRAPLPSLLATRACDVRESETVEALEGREGGMCVVSEEHELSRMSRERSERESKVKFEQQRMRREKKNPKKSFFHFSTRAFFLLLLSLPTLAHPHQPFSAHHHAHRSRASRVPRRAGGAGPKRGARRRGRNSFRPPSISVAIENKCFHSHAFFFFAFLLGLLVPFSASVYRVDQSDSCPCSKGAHQNSCKSARLLAPDGIETRANETDERRPSRFLFPPSISPCLPRSLPRALRSLSR